MQSKKIRTPLFVQVTFIVFFVLMMTPFLAIIASASPLERYCDRQYQNYRFWPLLPVAKKCDKIFERKTQAWISWDYSNY